MTKLSLKYLGELRNELRHHQSGNKVITDAPTDNNGKGEAFSPTDLLSTALASCMITLIGITANSKGIQLGDIDADVEKIMGVNPRRVSEVRIDLRIENQNYSEKEKSILKNAAINCPVAKSLNHELNQAVNFVFY